MVHGIGSSTNPYALFLANFFSPPASSSAASGTDPFSTGDTSGSGSNTDPTTSGAQIQSTLADFATAFQQFDTNFQAALLQLQSTVGAGAGSTAASDPATSASAANAGGAATSASTDPTGAASDAGATGETDTTATSGQAVAHHHHRRHGGMAPLAGSPDPSPTDAATLQSDADSLVNALFSMLQPSGTDSATGSTGDGTTAVGSTSTAATGATSPTVTSGLTAPSVQSAADIFAQDMVQAIQSYGFNPTVPAAT